MVKLITAIPHMLLYGSRCSGNKYLLTPYIIIIFLPHTLRVLSTDDLKTIRFILSNYYMFYYVHCPHQNKLFH
jgi:hypothetical protein